MTSMFHAFGLQLSANQIVPGLPSEPAKTPQDVQIELGSLPVGMSREFDPPTMRNGTDDGQPHALTRCAHGMDGFWIRFDDGTIFILDSSGTHVWSVWPESSTLEDTATYLLGPVLAFLLRLRGITCLHASAFCVEGRAVALVGPSGVGKSTTAAALARRGLSVVSDDTLALEERDDNLIVHPGYPRLRLWPDSVRLLFGTSNALPRLTPNWDKRYLNLQDSRYVFERASLPLAAVYFLEGCRYDTANTSLNPVSASAALVNLIGNVRGDFHVDRQAQHREFDMLGKLVGRLPIRRVVARAGPQSLDGVCDAILADLQSVHAPIDIIRH